VVSVITKILQKHSWKIARTLQV